jgi:hypothetical protein
MIKVGFCVAYDWELLKTSLPRIYSHADKICLSLDKQRKSWAGIQYNFDDAAFYQFVKSVDKDNKIDIYEADFYQEKLDKRQNCNLHRTMMSERMGEGGWHIQIDADEYYLDFAGFADYLRSMNPNPGPEKKAINVCCPFIPLFKKVSGGYLYVSFPESLPEFIPMATNKPHYQRARQNGHFNHYSPFYVVHETWARSEEELWFKINNWGHASEELQQQNIRTSYFNLWKAIDEHNYTYVHNINPSVGSAWPELRFGMGNSIEDFISNLTETSPPMSRLGFFIKNSRNVSRIKHLASKFS